MNAITVEVHVINPEKGMPKNCLVFGLVTNITEIESEIEALRETINLAMCRQINELRTLGRGVYIPNHGFLVAEELRGEGKADEGTLNKLRPKALAVADAIARLTPDRVHFSDEFSHEGLTCRAGLVVFTTNIDMEAVNASQH